MRRRKHLLWLPAGILFLMTGLSYASVQVNAQSHEPEPNRNEREQDPRKATELEYRARLSDMKGKFEALGDDITDRGERASQEWTQYEAVIKQQTEDLSRKIDEMGYRAGPEWQQLAAEVEQGLKSLDVLYDQAVDRFNY